MCFCAGNTPLMYACASGHEPCVRVLLEAGANVEDHNENGHTPLMEAASAGHVSVAKVRVHVSATFIYTAGPKLLRTLHSTTYPLWWVSISSLQYEVNYVMKDFYSANEIHISR